jgi:hypothetical protein
MLDVEQEPLARLSSILRFTPSYAMSLSEERRVTLREHIKLTVPVASDGSIHLVARAWAIRGVRKN